MVRRRGVTAQAVLTDNGSAYRSADFARACLAAGIRHRRTRPYRPQTNGKVERFTARCSRNGLTFASTAPSRHARPRSRAGCTTTITTAVTPPSAVYLRSAVSPTSRDSTASGRCEGGRFSMGWLDLQRIWGVAWMLARAVGSARGIA